MAGPARLQLPQDVLQARPALHGAHQHILPALQAQGRLEGGVHRVGKVLRAVAHQDHRPPRLRRVGRRQAAGKAADILRACQQRAAQCELRKGGGLRLRLQFIVFVAVEQMGRLHRYPLHPSLPQAIQRLGQAGDFLPPPGQDAADGGAGEGLAAEIAGGGLLQRLLHRRDGGAGLRHAGAEADNDEGLPHLAPAPAATQFPPGGWRPPAPWRSR